MFKRCHKMVGNSRREGVRLTNQVWMTGALDLAGQPRIQGPRVDMDAYEAAYTPPRHDRFLPLAEAPLATSSRSTCNQACLAGGAALAAPSALAG